MRQKTFAIGLAPLALAVSASALAMAMVQFAQRRSSSRQEERM